MSDFPLNITNKNWQKNKGLVAKAKSTGIGESLAAMAKAYDGSAWSLDTVKLGTETVDPLAFKNKFDAYVKTLAPHAK